MTQNIWNPFRGAMESTQPSFDGSSYHESLKSIRNISSPYAVYPRRTNASGFWNTREIPNAERYSSQPRVPQNYPHSIPPTAFQYNNGMNYNARGYGSNVPGGFRGRQKANGYPRNGPYHSGKPTRQKEYRPPTAYYCEACEHDFKNYDKYQDHIAKHVKCPKCEFFGMLDVVEEHFELIHLFAKLKSRKPVETEEDIRAWRKERSKNYPRARAKAENYQKQKAVVNHFRNADDPALRELSDGEIDDAHEITNDISPKLNGLASLLSNYASSDSDSEAPDEVPTKSSKEPIAPFAVASSENLDMVIENSNSDKHSSHGRKISNRTHVTPFPIPLGRKPRSFYEKLLVKDIERENDEILQCIAHICKKKFFSTV